MGARLSKVKEGDILVPPGGSWPADARFAELYFRPLTGYANDPPPADMVALTTPPYAVAEKDVRTLTNDADGLRGWRRVSPVEVYRQELREKDYPVERLVAVEVVPDEGAVTFFVPSYQPAYAGSDIDRAIEIAKMLAAYRLPPLDDWMRDEYGYWMATPRGTVHILPDGDSDFWQFGADDTNSNTLHESPQEAYEEAAEWLIRGGHP